MTLSPAEIRSKRRFLARVADVSDVITVTLNSQHRNQTVQRQTLAVRLTDKVVVVVVVFFIVVVIVMTALLSTRFDTGCHH